MSVSECQAEELEVLSSIFEDDEAFKKVSSTCIQYKIGDNDSIRSILIEFSWPPDYPNCSPVINMETFYNNRILPSVKQHIVETLNEQSENMLGDAMTYTLIDWAKENFEDLMADQPLRIKTGGVEEKAKKKDKKEQLTKAQKRKMADRVGAGGERPRGWNWIDPIKHLSQTGKSHERECGNT